MFSKLLVTLDGTPQAAAALPLARCVAQATGAELTLLQVVPDGGDRLVEQKVTEAQQYLSRIARELTGSGLRVQTRVRQGDPLREILWETRSEQHDLVVMAARARAGRGEERLGHLAEAVVTGCPVPVLTMRPGGHRVTRISTVLVPMRGHIGSTLALGAAVKLARAVKAKLVLLEVLEAVPAYIYEGGMLAGAIDPEWEQEARADAHLHLDKLADRLVSTGIQAEGQVRIGLAPEALVQAADEFDADLIVMTTHAHEHPSPAALGSVASSVLRTSRRPVLLIRHETLLGEKAVAPSAQEPALVGLDA